MCYGKCIFNKKYEKYINMQNINKNLHFKFSIKN